jgi:putative flippase GtrA
VSASNRKIVLTYPLIGVLNFVFSILVFWLLANYFSNLSPMELVLFSSIISIPVSHFMQRRYVWTSESKYGTELLKFSLISAGAMISNILLIDWFHLFLDIGIIQTQLILSLLIIATTFFIHYLWTFKR